MNDNLSTAGIAYRPGAIDDSYAVFALFEQTLAHMVRRFGMSGPMSWDDPAALAAMWEQRRPLYEHLARTCEYFWVAEREGEVVGYSRSILRGGVRQLTELFVRPDAQSSGAGRELITRSLPADGAYARSIIATSDFRAQRLYMSHGVLPRFPIYVFSRTPEAVSVDTDLTIQPIKPGAQALATLAAIDQQVIGFRRDVDHAWLLSDRRGFLYLREDEPVGYGYVGLRSGPFALLHSYDFPAVLAHAESQAVAQGHSRFGIEVPLVNHGAYDYVVERGFTPDAFAATVMLDRRFGHFERYIVTAPPLFL